MAKPKGVLVTAADCRPRPKKRVPEDFGSDAMSRRMFEASLRCVDVSNRALDQSAHIVGDLRGQKRKSR
jgi:hypothetical protein